MLRISRFRLPVDDAPAFEAFATETVIPRLIDAGMIAATVGARDEGVDRSYVVVSRFPRFEALLVLAGVDLERPTFLDDWRPRIIAPQADHYDAMDLEQPPAPSAEATLLRTYGGSIPEDRAAEFYEYIRGEAWPRIRGMPGLAAGFSGRRVIERHHEFLFVTLWRSLADLPDATWSGGPPLSESPHVTDDRVDHYRLIARS